MNRLSLCKILAFLLCGAMAAAYAVEESFKGDGESAAAGVVESKANEEKGIDVSHYQKNIDWVKVAESGVKHAFVKMSEGGTYVDPNFVQNWNGAKSAGIKVNCYHYFRALSATPEQQRDVIKKNLQAVKWSGSDGALAIDVEARGNEKATAEQMADNLNKLLTLIKGDRELSGLRVFIYTSYGYWNTGVKWNKYDFGAYPLWVAHFKVFSPVLPEPWKSKGVDWTWWQYSDSGSVDGVPTAVDLDRVMV